MTGEADPAAARQHVAPPCAMVIFGVTGDLTRRKLLPALYNLATTGLRPEPFAIVGVAREDMTSEQCRERIRREMREVSALDVDGAIWDRIQNSFYYVHGEFTSEDTYRRLRAQLDDVEKRHGTLGNQLHYLATPPQVFAEIVGRLAAAGLTEQQNGHWRRVIVEKPFGRDSESARLLNQELRQVLDERQIFRIDHYLGKETVQNMMAFRFANGIFEPIWNRRYVDHVQVTAAEDIGVEHRGEYYESAGALRDMVPNHLFQLLTLTAMEPPISFNADAVHDEQTKILHAIQPFSPEEVLTRVVRGQYGAGVNGQRSVAAYRDEPLVVAGSATETFVAMKLLIDNWRWAGVPFYVRTGKRLPRRATQIAIQFKEAPFVLFRDTPVDALAPNRLVLRIQPDEGITLHFAAKLPGPLVRLGGVDMVFAYRDYFGSTSSTGYERLLHDAMSGDATLFQRADMVEAAWNVVQPILDVWNALPARTFPNYAAGTWGPRQADELLSNDHRGWYDEAEMVRASA